MIPFLRLPQIPALAGLAVAVAVGAAALTGMASTAVAGPYMYAVKGFGSGADRGDVIVLPDQSNTAISYTVGNPAGGLGLSGIDFDVDGNLWGSTTGGVGTASNLIQINPNSGSLINSIGPIHTNAGDVSGSAISIGDLAYNSVTQTLYGIQSQDANPFAGGDIYTIDLGTGLASFIGSTIWGTTAGIAFDNTGTLYALGYDPNVGPFGTNMLFTLDANDASELTRVTVSLNDFIFSGLGINPVTNEIFATEDDFFATGTGTGNIYSVDAVTGTMTFLGKPSGVVSDIAFRVSEPGTLAVIGIGFAALAFIRRRRVG